MFCNFNATARTRGIKMEIAIKTMLMLSFNLRLTKLRSDLICIVPRISLPKFINLKISITFLLLDM